MIDKMQFISLTGPRDDFDRVIADYITKYDIQLENALSELKNVKHLKPFVETNPYKEAIAIGNEFLDSLGIRKASGKIDAKEALETIESLKAIKEEYNQKRQEILSEKKKNEALLGIMENFKEFHYNLDKINSFKFISHKFGRMPVSFYRKFEKYVDNELDVIFTSCKIDKEFVWGVYMTPTAQFEKTRAIFSSLHFEEIELPEEFDAEPNEVIKSLTDKIKLNEKDLDNITSKLRTKLADNTDRLALSVNRLEELSEHFDLRKMAAITGDENDNFSGFYIMCGWLSTKDANRLKAECEKDDKIYCVFEDYEIGDYFVPPTKLKNPKIFKPFEMYIKMYGMPNYNEFDPTVFVALTYSFIFGAMFGDVGQGLVLFLGGILLYRFKKSNLAAIIGTAGIFSTIFGFMFGSIFGFENIIDALWLRPIEAMTDVPFIGKLNTVFVIAIGFGMVLVLITMIINIINGIREKNIERAFFDTNGIAGLVFYASVVICAVLLMTGRKFPAAVIMTIMFLVPLMLIFFKEPITRKLTKAQKNTSSSVVMFLVQGFFELFEVLLSYFSNTLSFVRIGAFAVSHAAMMEVVLMLAGAENGGTGNLLVIVLGNIFVCGLEGLIVGIQVLRLEYYELFSRFYKGNGREFIPTINK